MVEGPEAADDREEKMPEVLCDGIRYKRVIPVVFHVLNSAPTIGTSTFKITAEAVKKNLDRMNQVFNRLITTDPNGGSARIRFEAAKYDPSGKKLPLEGIHQWNISGEKYLDGIDDYEEYVNKQKV